MYVFDELYLLTSFPFYQLNCCGFANTEDFPALPCPTTATQGCENLVYDRIKSHLLYAEIAAGVLAGIQVSKSKHTCLCIGMYKKMISILSFLELLC